VKSLPSALRYINCKRVERERERERKQMINPYEESRVELLKRRVVLRNKRGNPETIDNSGCAAKM
jgi:hypothetical protein